MGRADTRSDGRAGRRAGGLALLALLAFLVLLVALIFGARLAMDGGGGAEDTARLATSRGSQRLPPAGAPPFPASGPVPAAVTPAGRSPIPVDAQVPLVRGPVRDGWQLVAAGDFEAGRRALDRAVVLRPEDHEAWYWRAITRDALGFKSGALGDVEQALQLRPDFRPGMSYAAVLDLELGRPAEALASASKLVAAEPDYEGGLALGLRARAALAAGNAAQAVADGARACALGNADGCRAERQGRAAGATHWSVLGWRELP